MPIGSVRSVGVRFTADVQGAVANIGKLTKATKDSATAGIEFARKNKGSFDEVATAAGGLGLTAAAGLGLAVKRFADFDKAMSSVKAATGETAGNMDLLREAAMQAGKDTAFSATEAAQGIENLAKAGVSTKDILGGGLKGALDLAAAGQIDVGEAAETAATALTQFKLSGKDVPHVADLLAAGAGKAQGEVTDMAQALKQSGLVAAQFGLSVEETTGTLAAFASAGLIGSDSGTSFKTMLLQLANPSKQAAQTMKDLGINAYDASGAFIGIAPLADQLKTKMSGLTEEQRNAALATIFGSDAIRAANVLYTNGAAGIADWTTKVNDTGFAAEQARTKTDNLAGDVERLGGAFDTALIQGGSGANGVLRAITQTADAAVSAFGDLPPVVSGAATALAAVGTVGGLGAAGVLKAASAAGELKQAWGALGKTGRTLTLSMGAVGVALTAGAAIYGIFAKRNEEAKQKVDDLRSTLDEATGAITGNTRAFVANDLAQSGLAQKAKDLGLNLSTVTDAALGNKGALDSLVGSLNKTIDANNLAALNGTANTDQSLKNADAATKLRDELLGMNGALSDAQQKQRLAAEGAKTNASATDLAAAASAKAKAAADAQKQSLDDLIATMLQMPGQVLSLRDAQRQVEAAFDGATDALKENGRTLDISTPKGRANQAALDGMADAANDVTKTLVENGGSQKALQSNLTTSRARLIAVAQQMGLSKAAAKAYADRVLAIPPTAKTDVTVNTGNAAEKLAQIKRNIDALKSKSVTVTVNHIERGPKVGVGGREAGGEPGRAAGGPIPGFSPTPTADNVPIWATAGEWMQPVAAVNYYGTSFMEAVRTRRFPKEKARGYASGGEIMGFAGGGQIPGFDFNTLFRQLFASVNPLAGADTRATLRAQQVAWAAEKKAWAELKRVRETAAKGSKVLAAAEKKYANAAAASSKATDANTAAVQKLAEARKQAADVAASVAAQQLQGSGIVDLFGEGVSRGTLLARLQGKGKELAGFATTLEGLQKNGLSSDLLDQLRSAGPSSAAIAKEILAGGKGYINQLNAADIALQGQANRIGAGAAAQFFNTTYVSNSIEIGGEVVRVVEQTIRSRNAAVRRTVGQRTGGR